MADWKKVVVSGSSGVELNSITLKGTAGTIINNSTVAGTKLTGSFTGSFDGLITNATSASYVLGSNVDGAVGSATSATNASNSTNVITVADTSDTEAFITFGNAGAATQQLKTNSNIKANLATGNVTAAGFTGSLKGAADTATSASHAVQADAATSASHAVRALSLMHV